MNEKEIKTVLPEQSRAERRRLERIIKHLVKHIEDAASRRAIIRLAQEPPRKLIYEGKLSGNKKFALCATPDGLRYGEKYTDGACDLEAYGPDGELLIGWGGDGFDLLEEVTR